MQLRNIVAQMGYKCKFYDFLNSPQRLQISHAAFCAGALPTDPDVKFFLIRFLGAIPF